MTLRKRSIVYLLLPILAAGVLIAGWKTFQSDDSSRSSRQAAAVQETAAAGQQTAAGSQATAATGTVEPPSNQSCQYDPSVQLKVAPDELVSFQDPMKGNPDADVTVVEFFDPNCSHCQSFQPVMKQVVAEYSDQIRFYAIPFPLWKYSVNQVEAMVLAARQDKFYEMIDIQLSQRVTRGMSDQQLISLADSLDMNTDTFAESLRNDEARRRALYYAKRGRQVGIPSTPTVVINGRVVAGDSRTADCLGNLIERELDA